MKKILILIIGLLILNHGYSQTSNEKNNKEEMLIGEWQVDLRPTPDSEAYYQTFELNSIKDNTFKGKFYGSSIKNGLLNFNWERTYISFTTSDSSHDYYHSAYLENGKLYGISYCPGRKFTAPWTAQKL